MIRPPPRSTLFPYTPLSRSQHGVRRLGELGELHVRLAGQLGRLDLQARREHPLARPVEHGRAVGLIPVALPYVGHRSEEHTSELQSQSNLVCRLLLEKKKHI